MKRVILLVVVLILTAAGMARADLSYAITFDEFPVGTMIGDQYASLSVEFLAGVVTPRLPQISMNLVMPTAPVLRPTGEPDYHLFKGDFWIDFTIPAYDVKFLSGDWDTVGTGVIDVYDASDATLIASLTNTGTGPQLIDLAGLGIIGKIYFNSIADRWGADIDNLDFTPIPEPGTFLLLGLGAVMVRKRR